MNIDRATQERIKEFWNDYVKDGKNVVDVKGKLSPATEFDKARIEQIKINIELIHQFVNRKMDLLTFKTTLDGENKRNNLWGFTAMKGQMFFNQLVNSQDNNSNKLAEILYQAIPEPHDIKEAKNKISLLEDFVFEIYNKEVDKRKAPKPSSIAYFLSYFWQIYNYEKWQIFYTSIVNSLFELSLWKEFKNQAEAYEYFYLIILEVKKIIEEYTKEKHTNWDIEHCFWWKQKKDALSSNVEDKENATSIASTKIIEKNTFQLIEYIPPIISDLSDISKSKDESSTSKGINFEKKVSSAFKMLGFELKEYGQGTGRNPDLIALCRMEDTAFIIDTKVRPEGYNIGRDDRAIKEYINKYTKKLRIDGYKKISFIIVSSFFNDAEKKIRQVVREITNDTYVKRLTLLTSEALLYLVAYKLKGIIKNDMFELIDFMLKDEIISGQDVIQFFEDV